MFIDEVETVLEQGEIIEIYPKDEPFPSRLILGWPQKRPLHVVAADDNDAYITQVITVYQPNPLQCEGDYKMLFFTQFLNRLAFVKFILQNRYF